MMLGGKAIYEHIKHMIAYGIVASMRCTAVLSFDLLRLDELLTTQAGPSAPKQVRADSRCSTDVRP